MFQKYGRTMVGVTQIDTVRKEEVRFRNEIERGLAGRVDQRMLGCFIHVKRMNEYGMVRMVSMADVSGSECLEQRG